MFRKLDEQNRVCFGLAALDELFVDKSYLGPFLGFRRMKLDSIGYLMA